MNVLGKKELQLTEELKKLRQRVKELEIELNDNGRNANLVRDGVNKFEDFFHSAADLIAIMDKDGNFIEINHRFEKESGYKREEIFGKNAFSCGILTKTSSEKTASYLSKLLAGEMLPMFEIEGVKKNGSIVPYEVRAVPIIEKNKIVAIQVNLRNMENRRRVEQALVKREEHHHTLFQLSPSGIMLENDQGDIIDVNPAFCNSLGYKREELVGKNVKIMAHPEHKDIVKKNIERLMTGELLRHVVKSIRKDGTLCYMELNEKKISLPNGKDGILCISEDISERIRAEEDLKYSEKSYRGLFESTSDAIYVQDKEGKFVTVNHGAEQMYGYPRDYFVGKTPEFLSAPGKNDLKKIMGNVKKAYAGEPQIFEFWGIRKNGEVFPKEVRLNKGAYFGENVIIAFAREITNQKRTEEELLKKSQQQENLLKTARHLTISLDIKEVLNEIGNGVMEILNTQSCTLYLIEQDLKTLRPVVAIDPNYKEEILTTPLDIDGSFTGQAVLAKRGLVFNETGPDSIGQQIPGTPEETEEKIIVAPFLVEEKVIGAMCLSRMKSDFSKAELSLAETFATYASAALKNAQLYNNLQKEVEEHNLAQDKVVELNLQYETFIQNNLVGIWKLDFSSSISTKLTGRKIAELILDGGKISDCNDALAKMYGLPAKEDIIGKYPKEFMTDFDSSTDRLEKFVENGYKTEMLETEEKDVRGVFHHFRNSYFGVIKDDNLHAIWGLQMDITDQRRLEEQLRQSQKLEAIGTLAGGIAHDFNNLLTVINGHAEMSMMSLESEHPSHKDIISILNAGKRAKTLTSQLLAFSRKQIYEPKIIDINQSISSLDKMLRRLIGEDIKIDTNLHKEIPLIKADPGQIQQILMNLIVNARDAINEKTSVAADKKIIIETNYMYLDEAFVTRHTGSSTGPHVVISVRDTGIGMNDETRDKIFEPFFTTKDKGLGTGLGMSTVYGIVKQNKGCIYAFSETGLGTTIKIYWPACRDNRPSDETQVLTKAALLGQESILVVEDDEGVRNFVVTALKDLGYTVSEAINGKKALELINQKKLKIELVITDLIMPEMNGKELAVEVEKILPKTRVLFTSGYTEEHIVNRGSLDTGINFLQKPYTLQALAKKVRDVLEV